MTDHPMAALLLRDTLPPPDARSALSRMRSLAPSDLATLRSLAGGAGGWPLALGLGPTTFRAEMHATPLPDAPSLAEAAYWWPGAREAVTTHRAHLVLSISPRPREGDMAGAVAAARRVMRIATALAEMAGDDALSVLWIASGALWRVPTFVAEARLPLALPVWVSLQPRRGPTRGAVGFTSQGLRAFIGREIRFEPTILLPPDEVARRCLMLARQFLAGGEVRQGVMILGPAERIRVRFADDGELGGPILALSAESLEVAR